MKKHKKKSIFRKHIKYLFYGIVLLIIILPVSFFLSTQKSQDKDNVYASTIQPIGPSGNWSMIFDDEFNSTSLNTSVWTPGWFGTGISGPVNSGETTCYNSNEVSEPGDGYLHLSLISQSATCKGSKEPDTGSLVSSDPHDGISGHTGFDYTYGYVEWRVYIPPTSSGSAIIANWPATWSDGEGTWPTTGENDTFEGLGGQACYHYHSSSGGPGGCATGNFTGWHTFGSDWEPGSVTYYYDGIQVGRLTNVTSSPQYLIMNNTQGSAGGQTVLPTTMLVDYVRVWQTCSTNCPSGAPTPVPTNILTATPTPNNAPTPTLKPTLTPVPCNGLTVTTPLTLNKTSVKRGQSLSGTATYTNLCSTNYTASNILIFGQSPKGTHYNFSPSTGSVTLLPNQKVTISSSLTIPNNAQTGNWIGASSYQTTTGVWIEDSAHQKNFSVK